MAALMWALAALLCAGCVSAQVTNSLAGQTPIVTNGVVLPDNTFIGSTYAQVAGQPLVAQGSSGLPHSACMSPDEI